MEVVKECERGGGGEDEGLSVFGLGETLLQLAFLNEKIRRLTAATYSAPVTVLEPENWLGRYASGNGALDQ